MHVTLVGSNLVLLWLAGIEVKRKATQNFGYARAGPLRAPRVRRRCALTGLKVMSMSIDVIEMKTSDSLESAAKSDLRRLGGHSESTRAQFSLCGAAVLEPSPASQRVRIQN
jgi:hypothetical protein